MRCGTQMITFCWLAFACDSELLLDVSRLHLKLQGLSGMPQVVDYFLILCLHCCLQLEQVRLGISRLPGRCQNTTEDLGCTPPGTYAHFVTIFDAFTEHLLRLMAQRNQVHFAW